MTPEQQIKIWADQMAATFEAQVKSIPDARYRARALRDTLNDIRPGLSNQVTAATVALQKQGVQPIDRALRMALVQRLEIYVKSVLKSGGAFDTESDLGDWAGPALGTFNSEQFSNIMDTVTESLTNIGSTASSITNMALENRRAQAELAAQEREAERQASIEELRVYGEIAAEERAAEIAASEEARRVRELELEESETSRRARLEAAASEREAREAELAAEEAAARARRQAALGPAAPPGGGGGGLLIAGIVGVLVIGGGITGYVLYKKSKKGKTK